MTKKRDRFFALFGAVLFLVTASALSIAVIWNAVSSKDTNNSAANCTTSVLTPPSAGSTKLEGTKLADFTPIKSVASLQVQDTDPGTGCAVKPGDYVTVDYTGALAATGVIFQSSKDSGQTFPFTVGQGAVIKGWDQGLIGMKVGGTRRLIIPASLAYGDQAQSGIPANSDLVFDVNLYKIGQ